MDNFFICTGTLFITCIHLCLSQVHRPVEYDICWNRNAHKNFAVTPFQELRLEIKRRSFITEMFCNCTLVSRSRPYVRGSRELRLPTAYNPFAEQCNGDICRFINVTTCQNNSCSVDRYFGSNITQDFEIRTFWFQSLTLDIMWKELDHLSSDGENLGTLTITFFIQANMNLSCKRLDFNRPMMTTMHSQTNDITLTEEQVQQTVSRTQSISTTIAATTSASTAATMTIIPVTSALNVSTAAASTASTPSPETSTTLPTTGLPQTTTQSDDHNGSSKSTSKQNNSKNSQSLIIGIGAGVGSLALVTATATVIVIIRTKRRKDTSQENSTRAVTKGKQAIPHRSYQDMEGHIKHALACTQATTSTSITENPTYDINFDSNVTISGVEAMYASVNKENKMSSVESNSLKYTVKKKDIEGTTENTRGQGNEYFDDCEYFRRPAPPKECPGYVETEDDFTIIEDNDVYESHNLD